MIIIRKVKIIIQNDKIIVQTKKSRLILKKIVIKKNIIQNKKRED